MSNDKKKRKSRNFSYTNEFNSNKVTNRETDASTNGTHIDNGFINKTIGNPINPSENKITD